MEFSSHFDQVDVARSAASITSSPAPSSISAPREKLAVSIPTAGEMLSIGRTSIYDLLNRGDLKSIKIGRRRLVLVDSIRQLTECAVEGA